MNVITRFAPSPTGMLHIGGARTALFNYLFAKRHGGKFLLRVEDTDIARSTDTAKQAILDGLNWLGLAHDGNVVYQSDGAARHKQVAEELVAAGKAYYCYATQEELAQMRADAEAKGEAFRYDRRWRNAKAEGKAAPEGISPSIRIKAPIDSNIVIDDAVQGSVTFTPDALDDFIILRSDGTPTYMLAVVVDDHDMGITHIIRGDDHFNNAARQAIIYQAMGWNMPVFAHIPLIHGADGAKLSKRHGATAVGEYAHMGFLPEAMRNYLLRLGWSHGDDEIISDEQAKTWFDLEHIGKSPARLDVEKLRHVNAHYLRLRDDADLAGLVAPHLKTAEASKAANAGVAFLARAIASVKNRVSTLIELASEISFYLTAPSGFDEKAEKTLKQKGENLALALPALQALKNWEQHAIKAALDQAANTHGKKLGEIMPPVRAAIVGAMSGPDVAEALEILGKEESLNRLKNAQEMAQKLAA